jgi:hypothetical protein
MKKRKPVPSAPREPGAAVAKEDDGEMVWTERRPARTSTTVPAGLRLAVTATKSGRSVKPKRGRLSRTVLAALGKGLEDCFDEIRKQEVPERFKLLLRQF